MNWLSYGAGVNSTALAILLVLHKVKGIQDDWTAIFADTGNEKDETYQYLEEWMIPYFQEVHHPLVIVRPKETVLERWRRLKVTGSRLIRSCTDEAKVRPIESYIASHGGIDNPAHQLIGIDAGELQRVKDKRYPLVELDIDREGCAEIIARAGIPIPPKSGCWHCPFMRVGEVLDLARNHPQRFAIIEQLEQDATRIHGPGPRGYRSQWGDKPASYYRERATDNPAAVKASFGKGLFFSGHDDDDEPPCGCYDG